VVEPSTVIFSVGRRRAGFPRPEIVRAVRSATPDAHIACTQLSRDCSDTEPGTDPTHLRDGAAAGKPFRGCCAGTVGVKFLQSGDVIVPRLADHRTFVTLIAPTRMCI
jgi:hypothetical protein